MWSPLQDCFDAISEAGCDKLHMSVHDRRCIISVCLVQRLLKFTQHFCDNDDENWRLIYLGTANTMNFSWAPTHTQTERWNAHPVVLSVDTPGWKALRSNHITGAHIHYIHVYIARHLDRHTHSRCEGWFTNIFACWPKGGGQSQFCSHALTCAQTHTNTERDSCMSAQIQMRYTHKHTKHSWVTSDDNIFGVPECIHSLQTGTGLMCTYSHLHLTGIFKSYLPLVLTLNNYIFFG